MFRTTITCLSAALLLAACGQSGDLYLPEKNGGTVVSGAPETPPVPAQTMPPAPMPAPSSPPPGFDDMDWDFDDDD